VTPAKEPNQLRFTIHGLDCAEEVAVLKHKIGPLVGGEHHLDFNILDARMTVTGSERAVTAEQILRAIAATGMRGELFSETSEPTASPLWQRHTRTALTVTSGLLLALGFAVHAFTTGGSAGGSPAEGFGRGVPIPAAALYAAAIVAGVWFVAPKAWGAVRRLRPDMNLLMMIAVCGAIVIGEWLEAATVSFLFAVSLTLESWSVARARRAVAALMDLAPPSVRLLDDRDREVHPAQVSVGTRFSVRPGERIALDGVVDRGTSHVNQAPITGESAAVTKQPGDQVFAGTINGDGALEITSTKPAHDTTLARITRMVREAQSRRAPSEQWVERFALYYTPIVMALALAVFLVPPILFGSSWTDWTYRALVLLVIACPCALVISTPVSIVAALASAARNGVLVKGGVFLEAPARLRAIAFDKTGTVTQGKPAVLDLFPLSGHTEHELLEIAASIESQSSHPLARAIVNTAESRGLRPRPADHFQALQGKGATAKLNGRDVWLGSHRHLEERGQETSELHERLERLTGAGVSAVVVGEDDHVCGIICVADQVRDNAKATMDALRAAGVQHLVMLTGDNRATGESVAGQVGVDEVYAELLPDDKVATVQSLVRRFRDVAMVGDGVNDAPALARATVGIAMGAAGTDAAIETADIALMTDDLSRLPWLIHHSRRTLSIIRQNIAASLFVKALFVVLTFAGHASLWAAIAADTGASLAVVLNGLRLLRTDKGLG
jgi:Cd2+/Zn2+-exporting ATPase